MHPANFHRGDPAPWFVARSTADPRYRFDTAAGRYVVLCFLGSAGDAAPQPHCVSRSTSMRGLFDDANACLVGVSTDPGDKRLGRLRQATGVRYIWDFDLAVSRLYGAVGDDDPSRYTRFWLVLDPMLRVLRVAPLDQAAVGDGVSGRVAAVRLCTPARLCRPRCWCCRACSNPDSASILFVSTKPAEAKRAASCWRADGRTS